MAESLGDGRVKITEENAPQKIKRRKTTGSNDIPIEYRRTPMYDSYYIESINNLNEFDCGSESEWMYKVNG